MTMLDNLLGKARRVVSPDGKIEWIVLEPEIWEALVERLEELEDLAILQEIEAQGEEKEAIPLEDALDMLRKEGVDV